MTLRPPDYLSPDGSVIDGAIIVTAVRDGRVYEWQGSRLARIPKSIFDQEVLPAFERGDLPWGVEVVDFDWPRECLIVERIDLEDQGIFTGAMA